ncbi:hypothetical protein [Sphaerotilus mobilis]|uniref:Uncharacterized protein n=1 Tax=Sphaerotilus mobilis TaxID=47994 RepID=A0A4Q7LH17_9BURK|nr:hypothetical protein [Sphaerotilus mobilis]RZS53402.1 hypothetical protein EV685_3030 [Sphaerotilus mobilis]
MTIESPATVCNKLQFQSFNVQLFEEPAHEATSILTPGSRYKVVIKVELSAKLKRILCGKWCVSVIAERIGAGADKEKHVVVPMNNCDDAADTIVVELTEDWLDKDGEGPCGNIYSLYVAVVALDNCHSKPVGLAGFARLGDVFTFS